MTDDPSEKPDAELGHAHSDELKALDKRLETIEKKRAKSHDHSAERGADQGFQVLGELLGGILGGLGLGWLWDQMAGTKPIGIIIGTILGMVAAVYAVVKRAQAIELKAAKRDEDADKGR